MTELLLKKEMPSIFFDSFLRKCQEVYGEETYNKWLCELKLFADNGAEVILAAPSKFMRDWVIREFVDNKKISHNLTKIANEIDQKVKKLNIISLNLEEKAKKSELTQDVSAKVVNISKHDNVFAFGSELNPKYTFANFVSTKYNKLAVAMAKIAAGHKNGSENAQNSLFSDKIPLYIHGGIGMGKTHLAQAIAWQIKEEDKSKKVVYLSAEKFMFHFVQAVRSNDTMNFKEKFRSIDVLIIDDVQFIAGKQGTQEEFMHTFNSLVENNKQVVLVCDREPSALESIDEKLKSRISGAMILNFKNPDFSDRLEILKAKASLNNEEVDEKVIEFLASKINTNVRDLDGALRKLIANKIFIGEEITLESAKNIALSYVKTNSNEISIEKIQKAVASHYEIKVASLASNVKTRQIARARQIGMYFSKVLTNNSLPKIGMEFGKNHATVIYAVKEIQKMIEADASFARELKILEEKIQN